MEPTNMEERCKKTGLIREQCHHCQAPPEYKMVELAFNGLPIVEILHKGGPIHEFDKHFRFGKSKTRLILACLEIVKELAATPNGEMPDIENQEVVDPVNGDLIFVEVYEELDHSSGRSINVPWVRLQSCNNPNIRIGLGRKKAKAIVNLRKELAEWANYNLGLQEK